jgi:hypothetical protein
MTDASKSSIALINAGETPGSFSISMQPKNQIFCKNPCQVKTDIKGIFY